MEEGTPIPSIEGETAEQSKSVTASIDRTVGTRWGWLKTVTHHPLIAVLLGFVLGLFGQRDFLCDQFGWFCPTPHASIESVEVVGPFHIDDLDTYLLTKHAMCDSAPKTEGLGPGMLFHVTVRFEYAREKDFALRYSLFHAEDEEGRNASAGLENWLGREGYPCGTIIGTTNNVDTGVYPLWMNNPSRSGLYTIHVFLESPRDNEAIVAAAVSEPFSVVVGRRNPRISPSDPGP